MEMEVKIARAAQIHSHRAESGRVETRRDSTRRVTRYLDHKQSSEILGSAPMNLHVLFCFISRSFFFFLFPVIHPLNAGADADADANAVAGLHSITSTGWDGRSPNLVPGLGLYSP